MRRGAKLLHAYAAAVVPRLTVVLRKSFGGAFIAMGSKGLGADRVYAWPGAQVDVMGAVGRRRGAAPPRARRRARPAARGRRWSTALAAHHEATTGGLTRALECGAVDEVVEPAETRRVLLHALADLPDRRGAHHANGPL